MKQEIRKMVRSVTGSPEASELIWSRIGQLEGFRKAGTVLCYMSVAGEVATAEAMDRYRKEGKRFAIPVVCGDVLALREYDPLKVRKGYMGIPEPTSDAVPVGVEEVEFAIVPGVAFDAQGHRLGHGKGFYDRLLPQLSCPTCGVCFRGRLVEKIPTDPWDRPVDMVICDD